MEHKTKSPRLADIVGQEKIKESLTILIKAAHSRNETLDHLLFCGASGFGKSLLAEAVANEMGAKMKTITGNTIEKTDDFVGIITNIHAGDILLIQHIELLRKPLIESLYPIIENFSLDLIIGKGVSARSIRLKLPHFTVIGTTSKPLQVNEKLRESMFEYVFTPYDVLELGNIIMLFAERQNIVIQLEAANLWQNTAMDHQTKLLDC